MAKFPTYEEMGKRVAEEALDGYVYKGRTLREWIDILSSSENTNKCEDAISRQAVINGVDNYIEKAQSTSVIDDFISFEELVVKALPPVTPKQKMGHWEWVPDKYYPKIGDWCCSECRSVVVESVRKEEKDCIPLYKYCPQCGIKLEEGDK